VVDMYATQMLLKRYPEKTWKALAVSGEFRSRYGTLIRQRGIPIANKEGPGGC
jgi:hypothetical protein